MKCIYRLIKENGQLKAQNQVVSEQNSSTNTNIADLQKKLSQYDKHYEDKLNSDFSLKLVDIKEQILFENQRLKKEIEVL